jgi:aminoglycoside phosphotransferase (APT) family kinase protein
VLTLVAREINWWVAGLPPARGKSVCAACDHGYRCPVLTPPVGLSEDSLVSVLVRHWRLSAASVTYRAVGWGSHHWEVTDSAGERWFVTADELHNKRVRLAESLDVAFERLRRALTAAVDLRINGCQFVIAPVPANGEVVVRAGEEFGVAVYPFVEGVSFPWDEFSVENRRAMLEMVIAVHTAPRAAAAGAMTDDFAISHRDELEALLDPLARGEFPERGPFTRPVAQLVAANSRAIGSLLARYDELAGQARRHPSRHVLTHGEPHPGNTMLTPDGWRLIDWDTALLAPPERDLWSLDPGDGSLLHAYAAATGVQPRPETLELYRIRWDLNDLALDASRFIRPHRGTAEDDKAWRILGSLIQRIGGMGPARSVPSAPDR